MISKTAAAWFATATVVASLTGTAVYQLASSTTSTNNVSTKSPSPSPTNAGTLGGGALSATQGNGSGNNGNGSGNGGPNATPSTAAQPPSKSLTVGGTLTLTGIAPGMSVVRTLTIGNPNNQDVVLQSVQTVVTGPSPAPSPGYPCTAADDFQVVVAGYNATTGV
ncbi:MAG: hypothetical protein QOG99_1322, partial [Frankiales bacterium]|nr:hypothetical protein [Frankiales bacterium]